MNKSAYPLICVSLLFLVGCTTELRSISNSGYYGGWGTYRGELSEFDILGTTPAQSEADIASVLASATPPKIMRGDKLLLIQSGAMVPDNDMMEAAAACFSVAPFAGVPPAEKSGTTGSLRLRGAGRLSLHIVLLGSVGNRATGRGRQGGVVDSRRRLICARSKGADADAVESHSG